MLFISEKAAQRSDNMFDLATNASCPPFTDKPRPSTGEHPSPPKLTNWSET